MTTKWHCFWTNNADKPLSPENTPVRERILRLDAKCFEREDLPLNHLLDKYLSYIFAHDIHA